jgi:hypothetical protein
MEEIKEKNNELNQESSPKKEWIKPDLEIIDIEGGFIPGAEGGSFLASP